MAKEGISEAAGSTFDGSVPITDSCVDCALASTKMLLQPTRSSPLAVKSVGVVKMRASQRSTLRSIRGGGMCRGTAALADRSQEPRSCIRIIGNCFPIACGALLSPSASVPVCGSFAREGRGRSCVCASWDFIICLRRAVKSAEAYFCVLHQEIRATLENCS